MRRVSSTSSLVLSLLIDVGCCVGVTVSCDEDVGDEGEDELEELVEQGERLVRSLPCCILSVCHL